MDKITNAARTYLLFSVRASGASDNANCPRRLGAANCPRGLRAALVLSVVYQFGVQSAVMENILLSNAGIYSEIIYIYFFEKC